MNRACAPLAYSDCAGRDGAEDGKRRCGGHDRQTFIFPDAARHTGASGEAELMTGIVARDLILDVSPASQGFTQNGKEMVI